MIPENEEIRIGVFICHCGSNIGNVIKCKELAEYAATLPGVAYAEDNLYTCSETGLNQIKENVKKYNLNRVVVASCTPRTHEFLFRETIHEVGLNPYLFEMVNIREQCSWVHIKDPNGATEKAKKLVRMGVGKAKLLSPLEKIKVEVIPTATIIGGGIAGITAANNLADQGFNVYLLEKSNQLGGILNKLYKIHPLAGTATDFIKKKIENLEKHENIEVLINATIKSVSGFVGKFNLMVDVGKSIKNIETGVILIATGALPLDAKELKQFQGKQAISQLELEQQLKNLTFNAKNVVMIQCAGSRIEGRDYCSHICCMTALNNALLIKDQQPNTQVTILYRDIHAIGLKLEQAYQTARKSGILFIKYLVDKSPKVEDGQVLVYNELIGEEISIPRDLVVLSTPLIANPDAKVLSKLFKIPLDENQFFLEAHVKLRPVDFATDGIFVCGCAKWPADVPEAVSQAYAAASRASTILSHNFIEVEGSTAKIPEWNKDKCVGCEVCIRICPFGAISKDENGIVNILQVLCKGCGTCAATCPEKAIIVSNFTSEQIEKQLYELGAE